MKTLLAIFAATAIASLAGCGKTINVIHSDNVVTNTVPLGAFQDETYVWESWQYGTNRANRVIIK